MGNQITAIAPAQILPLESYFSDLTDFSKPISLGSTRFFKVARATHKDTVEVVVKVFAKHDPSLQLGTYELRLHDLKIKLHGIANALPFEHFWESDKAAFLVRQHVHYNLYDRISTRPFLSVMEKKWIVFQLLKVLEECHSKKICHGDIKTENVLLTGWDWVLLADFASFKPILLPADNPADYSFFFDTSRRRTCYIAPERFIHAFQDLLWQSSPSEIAASMQSKAKTLRPSMDIFSLGCVIAELFTDGRPLFDLSQLLEYFSGEYSPDVTLKRIADKHIRRMVRHMIQLKEEERFTAEEYLQIYKETIFPEFFYSFLHDYFKLFSVSSQLTPDQCIQKLYGDIEAILANLLLSKRKQERETGYGGALVIILSAITSHLRVAKFASSKLQALEMVKQISRHSTDECILERVVPYLVILLRDKWPSVKAEAIRSLTFCLGLVRHLPRSDFNLFPEFIIPSLNLVPSDKDVMVRIAFAESVAELAKTAHRFLELAQLQANQVSDESSVMQYQVQGSYDSELTQLQESFQGKIVHLLSDTESSVKKAFLKHSAGKLCVFFGPLRAKEVILSHMITFLNDKSDWELHGAFFECIVSVGMLLGRRNLPILEPLLQQGLSDPEETVICKTIKAMTALCECNLFDHHTLVENIGCVAPFLVHPNIWVRYSAVGFLCAAGQEMDDIDMECYIMPRVVPYLQHTIIQLREESILLSALKEPIPREVLDYILKQHNIREVFECLTDRQMTRNMSKAEGPVLPYKDIDDHLVQTFRKLQSLGLNEEHENSLMTLKDHLLKQHENKQLSSDYTHSVVEADCQQSKGVVDLGLKKVRHTVSRHTKLVYENPFHLPPAVPAKSKRASSKVPSIAEGRLSDWERIFGSVPPKQPSKLSKTAEHISPVYEHEESGHKKQYQQEDLPSSAGHSPLLKHKYLHVGQGSERSRSTEDSINMAGENEVDGQGEGVSEISKPRMSQGHKRSHSDSSAAIRRIDPNILRSPVEAPQPIAKVEHTSCMENLHQLLAYKQSQFVEDMKEMNNDLVKNAGFQCSPGWSPKGQLIAHIQEHKESINRISVLPDSTIFATFSDDSTTKIWDVQKLEGRNLISRAKLSYSSQGGQIKTGIFCLGNTSIAAASNNGTIHVFTLESLRQKAGGVSSSSTRRPLLESVVDAYKCGTVVEMANFTAGGQNVISYATSMGKLCGLDLRSGQLAWELTNNAKFGLVLSMAVDPFENWVALGTSLGYHVIWDMRFQLPIRHWQHTGHSKVHVHQVYRLAPHPTHPSSLVSAVMGNNEVSVWDMETASRRQIVWASPTPPFGKMTDNPQQHHSVRGLAACIVDNCPVVLTGGTDRIIRLWNLADPSQCCCVVRPRHHSKRTHVVYKSRIIEGVEVLKEVCTPASSPSGGAPTPPDPVTQPESAHVRSHVDFITDLSLVPYKSHQFVVSASHDGVLKLWK